MGMRRIGWAAIAGVALALAAPARAFCGGVNHGMLPVEFAPGSAAIDAGFGARVVAFAKGYGEAGREIDSLAVLAMGDLGEGAEYDAASAEARAKDKALGEARLAAIRDAVTPLGEPITDTKVRPTRQIITPELIAANPMLNERVRAGVFIYLAFPRAKTKPGEPVPLC